MSPSYKYHHVPSHTHLSGGDYQSFQEYEAQLAFVWCYVACELHEQSKWTAELNSWLNASTGVNCHHTRIASVSAKTGKNMQLLISCKHYGQIGKNLSALINLESFCSFRGRCAEHIAFKILPTWAETLASFSFGPPRSFSCMINPFVLDHVGKKRLIWFWIPFYGLWSQDFRWNVVCD